MKSFILALLLLPAFFVDGQTKSLAKKPTDFKDIKQHGFLESRLKLSLQRLQEDYFQWSSISTINFEMFPGDAVGRCINGLTLLSQALHQPATSNLEEIMRRSDELFNSEGYLGAKLPVTRANEDVMAGHNGILCGLTEYINWTNDESAKIKLKSVVDNLIVPVRNAIKLYRVDSKEAEKMNWVLSGGDIGQLFLALDGMTRAYVLYPSEGLKATIETAIERYQKLDLVAIGAQTHAMLSAATGILRWYELQHRSKDLVLAQKLYKQYRELAMTETFENFNWFNRPEWTEACAVTDSYILSVNLWRLTSKASYLEDAHMIFFNGVLAGQLRNGGFGTSPCVSDQTAIYTVKEHAEAPFCCTMRGAEGLSRNLQHAYFTENSNVIIPFYTSNTATLRLDNGTCKVFETTEYPYAGKVRFEVLESQTTGKNNLNFFVPSWVIPNSFEVRVNGEKVEAQITKSFANIDLQLAKGTVIEIVFQQHYGASTALHPNKSNGALRYFNGPLLLASASDKAKEPFIPIMDLAQNLEINEPWFAYFPQNKKNANLMKSTDPGSLDIEKNCTVYRCDIPEEKVTDGMQKLFAEFKYDRKKVIFGYIWDSSIAIGQVILQWPESSVMPKPDDVVLQWTEDSNKVSAAKPGIIGNGRQWVYSLDKEEQVKSKNNLVLMTKTQNVALTSKSIPVVTLRGR